LVTTKTAIDSFERAVQLDPNFALAWARLSRVNARLYYMNDRVGDDLRDAAKEALENAQKLEPNSPETLLALGYYQYSVLRDYGAAKTTFGLVSKMLPANSEVPAALGTVARAEGRWDQSIDYFEQALALDPRNVDLLSDAAWTYGALRQFPTALKLYDRALDIMPNNPDLMASKANIYQTQGDLQGAAKLLSQINAQTPSVLEIRIAQFRFERNYAEAIRLQPARVAQINWDSDTAKATGAGRQLYLAMLQLAAGDSTGAKVTAEQARNMLEGVSKTLSDHPALWVALAHANALIGEKDSARRAAERATMLLRSDQDAIYRDAIDRAGLEEALALVQTMLGENSRAISTLTRLLQTPYPDPITPALLRLDPFWDPLRSDPAFQKLCEEKPK
jgi:tetratricopeptide (TPR) repeat protein